MGRYLWRWRCLVIPMGIYLLFLLLYLIADLVGQHRETSPTIPEAEHAAEFDMHIAAPAVPDEDLDDTLYYRPVLTNVCANLSRPHPNILNREEKFHTTCTRSSYVFSAFFDRRRKSSVVRVVGIGHKVDNCHPENCVVWYPRRSQPDVTSVKVVIIPESHDKSYSGFLYTCILPRDLAPYAVTVARNGCHDNTVSLRVLSSSRLHRTRKGQRNALRSNSPSRYVNLTVCVPPIHGNYNDVDQLIEMMEVHRMFGAGRFIFYNYSMDASVGRYLRHYANKGVAEIVAWPFSDIPIHPSDIHYHGQLSSINDCLYRSLQRSKFITFLDLDEVLVPRQQADLLELVLQVQASKQNTPLCSFVFPNAFFHADESNHLESSSNLHMRTLNLLTRRSYIWPHGFRSKYISPVALVELAGVHFPWMCLGPRYDHFIPSEEGLLHHYRAAPVDPPPGDPDYGNTESEVDDHLLKYTDTIARRVQRVHRDVHKTRGKLKHG